MNRPGLLDCMKTVIARDVRIALRRRADVMTSLIFFVIVVSLFPLGIGADPVLLRTLGPGVVWVAALLACSLKTWKRDVARTLAEQRGRGFEPSDAAKLYFG